MNVSRLALYLIILGIISLFLITIAVGFENYTKWEIFFPAATSQPSNPALPVEDELVLCKDKAPVCTTRFSTLIGFHVLLPSYIPQGLRFDPDLNAYARASRGYDGTPFSPYVQYALIPETSDSTIYGAVIFHQSQGIVNYLDLDYKKDVTHITEVRLRDGTSGTFWAPTSGANYLYFEKSGIHVRISNNFFGDPNKSKLEIVKIAESLQ